MPLVLVKEKEIYQDDLKTCPCCGGEAVLVHVSRLFLEPGEVTERITCVNCGLTLEDAFGQAKEKWNARVENPTRQKCEVKMRGVDGSLKSY